MGVAAAKVLGLPKQHDRVARVLDEKLGLLQLAELVGLAALEIDRSSLVRDARDARAAEHADEHVAVDRDLQQLAGRKRAGDCPGIAVRKADAPLAAGCGELRRGRNRGTPRRGSRCVRRRDARAKEQHDQPEALHP